ncbi:LOW QUALITY PROTEIN: MORN repeat-containing protein 1-like, partial [Ruditapes philippinarum]|uniref:LOW QUALITY PROTEIN: MORN repeat-containing protein 1-like n=1 Tax=Ruditapes philippinarum TaxID=129788 RepID=UPI00295B0BF7
MPGEKKGQKKVEDGPPAILSGTFVFPNGDKYEGEYIQEDGSYHQKRARCSYNKTDGSVYDGEWANGQNEWNGKLSHHLAHSIQGEFVNNQFHGHGVYTWPNGSSYEGEFHENRLEGKGNFTDTENQMWTGPVR